MALRPTWTGKAVTPVPAPAIALGASVYWITGVQGTCGGMVVVCPPPMLNTVWAGLLADCSSSQRSFWSRLDAARSASARAVADLVVSIHGHSGGDWAFAGVASTSVAASTVSACFTTPPP